MNGRRAKELRWEARQNAGTWRSGYRTDLESSCGPRVVCTGFRAELRKLKNKFSKKGHAT